MAAFRARGRLTGFIASVPVRIVVAANVGLLGAAAAAEEAQRRPKT
jgi:glucokinase